MKGLTMNKLLLLILLMFYISLAQAQKQAKLAPAPPMGWNSWNYFGKEDINEKIVYEVIDAMVSTGLRDAGYNYVVIDGGWRDEKLAPDGGLLSHPQKFPNGIKPIADYAHSKGLKLGLHTVPGTHDCGGNPVGGYGHEEKHVKQFVEWGIDFIKLDKCRMTDDPCETCPRGRTGWSDKTEEQVYKKWSRLLAHCGRDILFSVSAYRFFDWYPEYSNMARTTRDIYSKRNKEGAVFDDNRRDNTTGFLSVMACAEINNASANHAGNGYWNDPDMMVTGNPGLTEDEEISHIALWAIISAPLFLGNDPRNMTDLEKRMLLNKEIIAINQDPKQQGVLIENKEDYQVWKKDMSDGSAALLLLNKNGAESKKITIDFRKLGLRKRQELTNVLTNRDLGRFRKNFSIVLQPHQSILFRVKK